MPPRLRVSLPYFSEDSESRIGNKSPVSRVRVRIVGGFANRARSASDGWPFLHRANTPPWRLGLGQTSGWPISSEMGDSIDVGRSTAGDSYPPRLKTWATQYASIPIICNDMATQAWTMPPAAGPTASCSAPARSESATAPGKKRVQWIKSPVSRPASVFPRWPVDMPVA